MSAQRPLLFFYASCLSVTGGGPNAMVMLAEELVRRGYELVFFTRPPFNPQHRYVQRLAELGVSVQVLPRFDEWRAVGWLVRLLAALLTLPYALWRRRSLRASSLRASWVAARSIIDTRVSHLERRYIRRQLARAARGSERVILQVWGPAALTPLLLDWAAESGACSIYHEMGEADAPYVQTWKLEGTVAAINRAQRVICCSRVIRENIRTVYGYRGEVATIPFMTGDPGDAPKRNGSKRNGKVRFGAIGRLVPHKRHADLIRAVKSLSEEGYNVGLVIAGDGPARGALEAFAAEQGVAERVTFTGEFERLEDVMRQFDVFTLTSSSESQCMPITESMAYGKPVIASDFGGIPDFVEDGVTGYLVPVGDVERLTGRLREIVRQPELRDRMGRQGRARYERLYTPTAVADAVEKVYQSLCQARSEERPARGLRLGYFVECYTTFIVNEVLELRRLGAPVAVFNAFRPEPESDPVNEALRRDSHYFPPRYAGVLSAFVRTVLRRPLTVARLLALLRREPGAFRMLVLAAYYAQLIRRRRITHLHGTFGTRTTTLAYLTAALSGIGFSFTTHAYDVFNDNPSLLWKTERAQFMRTISAYNKSYMTSRYAGINGEKIVVGYLGVDTEKFQPAGVHGQPAATPTIVSVGSLIFQKGHSYLIKACQRLRAREVAFECQIIGGGRLEEQFQSEIDDLSLADKVILRGALPVEEVRQALAQAQVFVLACVDMRGQGEHIDGIPVALMEAMAMGLPVVSTPLSGIPELIEDGISGVLVPEKDEAALADALQRLLADAPLRAALGRRARQRIEERFDIRANTRQLAQWFQSATRDKAPL